MSTFVPASNWLGRPLAFELIGPDRLLSQLHDLVDGKGLKMWRSERGYLLELPFFGIDLSDPGGALLELAFRWQGALNVAARLYLHDAASISVGDAYAKTATGWERITCWLRLAVEIDSPIEGAEPEEFIRHLVLFHKLSGFSGKRDRHAIVLLSAIADSDLRSTDDVFRLYDALRMLIPEKELVSRGYLSRTEIERLRMTLNYPGSIPGKRSRKIFPKGRRPKQKPMSWPEVTKTLRRVLRQWVRSKAEEHGPLAVPVSS